MRVLVVGVDYAPDSIGIAPYTAALAEHLATVGHEVKVITTFPHYPTYRWTSGRRLRSRETRSGVNVVRWWCLLPRRNTLPWRLVFEASFGVFAFLEALAGQRPDVIISVCVPLVGAAVGAAVAPIRGARTVTWVQDLPAEAAQGTRLLGRQSWVAGPALWLQYHLLRRQDRVIVIARAFRDHLVANRVATDRIEVIPNWVRNNPLERQSQRFRASLGSRNGTVLFLHSGNIGAKQGLEDLIDASLLVDARQVRITIVGNGSRRASLASRAALVSAPVTLRDLVPADSYPELLDSADVCIVHQAIGVVDSVVPSKLLTYMAAGKPVLAVVDSDSPAAAVVTEANCGVVVQPGDPTATASAVERLARLSDAERQQVGARGREYAMRHFGRDSVLKIWTQAIDEMSNRHG